MGGTGSAQKFDARDLSLCSREQNEKE
jgi:hypothetical protein